MDDELAITSSTLTSKAQILQKESNNKWKIACKYRGYVIKKQQETQLITLNKQATNQLHREEQWIQYTYTKKKYGPQIEKSDRRRNKIKNKKKSPKNEQQGRRKTSTWWRRRKSIGKNKLLERKEEKRGRDIVLYAHKNAESIEAVGRRDGVVPKHTTNTCTPPDKNQEIPLSLSPLLLCYLQLSPNSQSHDFFL